MFTLAHLSDPHLAPLPEPRWSELIGKRVTGYLNWQRRRRFIHDAESAGQDRRRPESAGGGPHRRHRRLTNIALPEEFVRGARMAAGPRRAVTT